MQTRFGSFDLDDAGQQLSAEHGNQTHLFVRLVCADAECRVEAERNRDHYT